MFELEGNAGAVSNRLYDSALHRHRLGEKPCPAQRSIHDNGSGFLQPPYQLRIRWRDLNQRL